MSARIDAVLRVVRPHFVVSAEFAVPSGGCFAILGPNGAGKSTVLAALAGLTPLDDGVIRVGERVLESAGAERPRLKRLRPEQRRVALLDQKPRLFPHLSALRNVAFGPRSQGRSRSEALAVAAEWLERIGLEHRGTARPHELSGGQQQRVALARAFAARPDVLLLDEPFAALDAESAPSVRRMLVDELRRTEMTSVLVTHDLADAWQLADDCLVLERGRVIEHTSPAELASRPRHPFTAALAGFSVVRGRWSGGALVVGSERLGGTPGGGLGEGQAAIGILDPAALRVSADPGQFPVVLSTVSTRAGVVRLEDASGLAAELSFTDARRLAGGRLPAPGDRLWFTPTPERMRIEILTGSHVQGR